MAQKCDKGTITDPVITFEKSVQCRSINKVHFRSKAVQTIFHTRDTAISPFKPTVLSSYTSPFKIQSCFCHEKPSAPGAINIKKRINFMDDEKSESDVSLYTENPLKQDSSSVPATSSKLSESSTSIACTNEDIEKMQCLKNTLRLIVKKPMMYIGIPVNCYFLVHLIHKHTHIPHEHILMCLKKIKLNSTFSELEDNFGLSLSYCSKLFLKNIPIIASFLRPFIVKLNKPSIRKTLPISFHTKGF